MKTLTNPQAAAVSSDHSRILTIAGPGSGKTRTLIERIRRLIDDGVSPSQIVAITFTNAAADEIQHRLATGEKAKPLGYVGTLHGFLLRLIQKNSERLGYATSRLAVLDEEQTEEIMARTSADLGYKGTKKAVLEADTTPGGRMSIAAVVKLRVDQIMKRNGLLSYDAILTEGQRLIETGLVLPYLHLFVDEVQDLSDLQAEIVTSLPIPNRFLIGDPDQSIFAFNGGNVNHIMEFSYDPGAEIVWLEDNFRCDRLICAAANVLIEKNEGRINKTTRPTGKEFGEIEVRSFQNPLAEQMDRLHLVRTLEGSTAILCRLTAHVEWWRESLRENGIPMAETKRIDRPVGWPRVRKLLAAMVDPENDWLLLEALRTLQPDADHLNTVAIASGSSLNSLTLKIPRNLLPSAYGQTLARHGLSEECVEVVNRAAFGLPDGGTGADLMAALVEEEKAGETVGEGIVVTTMHSAKGREWDNVLLPCFEEQIIPATRDVEEERRLAYVAVTRARHRLFISYAGMRQPMYGRKMAEPVKPSRFIQEMGL